MIYSPSTETILSSLAILKILSQPSNSLSDNLFSQLEIFLKMFLSINLKTPYFLTSYETRHFHDPV